MHLSFRSTFALTKKDCSPKIFWLHKILGSKEIGANNLGPQNVSKNVFWSIKSLIHNILYPKKIGSKKLFGYTKCWLKRDVDSKLFMSKIFFETKYFWSKKHFLVQKILGWNNFWVKKFGSKKFWSEKNLDPKSFGSKKK